MDSVEILDEIEELIGWNLSFGITTHETLKEINRLDLLTYFSHSEFM